MSQIAMGLATLPPEGVAVRADLTPDDLQRAGWWVLDHVDSLPEPSRWEHLRGQAWTAGRWNTEGGVVFAGHWSLEVLIEYIRHNRIALLPWSKGFG